METQPEPTPQFTSLPRLISQQPENRMHAEDLSFHQACLSSQGQSRRDPSGAQNKGAGSQHPAEPPHSVPTVVPLAKLPVALAVGPLGLRPSILHLGSWTEGAVPSFHVFPRLPGPPHPHSHNQAPRCPHLSFLPWREVLLSEPALWTSGQM